MTFKIKIRQSKTYYQNLFEELTGYDPTAKWVNKHFKDQPDFLEELKKYHLTASSTEYWYQVTEKLWYDIGVREEKQ